MQTLKARARILEIVEEHLKRKTTSSSSFLDVLLQAATSRLPEAEAHIEQEHAKSLFMELFFGSNSTTASTLCAIMICLSNHPDVVQQIREEVDQYRGEITYNVIKQMHYVNDVQKEVLRLFPPIAAAFRKTLKPFPIGVGQTFIDVYKLYPFIISILFVLVLKYLIYILSASQRCTCIC